MSCFFFFSSRRRHTRLQGDWSSDVCSSDLVAVGLPAAHRAGQLDGAGVQQELLGQGGLAGVWVGNDSERAPALDFSLERRIGGYGLQESWNVRRGRTLVRPAPGGTEVPPTYYFSSCRNFTSS